jgi:hypothetical protein
MKGKIQFVAVSLSLALISLVSAPRVWAQHSHEHKKDADWKIGMLRVSKPVWAGDVRLKSGMYHVKHVVEGDSHWLVFKSVTLGAGYREGLMAEGEEIARLECKVESTSKSVRNTKVTLTKTSAGISRIQEIQIAGEKVRHTVQQNPSTV